MTHKRGKIKTKRQRKHVTCTTRFDSAFLRVAGNFRTRCARTATLPGYVHHGAGSFFLTQGRPRNNAPPSTQWLPDCPTTRVIVRAQNARRRLSSGSAKGIRGVPAHVVMTVTCGARGRHPSARCLTHSRRVKIAYAGRRKTRE